MRKFHRNWVSDKDGNVLATLPLQVPFSLNDFFNGGSGAEQIQAFSQVPNVPIRINNLGFYVQDEWRIRPNFSVTAALRLEHNSNPSCVTDCFSTFAGGLSQAIANEGAAYNTLIQTGRSQALYNYQNLMWQPRVSFAWQPFGSSSSGLRSNLVVRGGIGIFNDVFPGQIADNMSQNSPQYNQFSILGDSVGGSCVGGYLSPNQPGNLLDCQTAANTAFQTAFAVERIRWRPHRTSSPRPTTSTRRNIRSGASKSKRVSGRTLRSTSDTSAITVSTNPSSTRG